MKFIDIKEVSALIGAKTTTVYQWAELGQIPNYKINGLVRFEETEILEWLKENKRRIIA